MSSPFLYFGFGSNLEAARLHIHCPSAHFLSTMSRMTVAAGRPSITFLRRANSAGVNVSVTVRDCLSWGRFGVWPVCFCGM